MSRTLVLDRSSDTPGVALFDGAVPIFSQTWNGAPTRAPEWVADLAMALADRGIDLATVTRYVCGLGPGSFSGIRAALSALQGMALPGRTRLQGIASAAALAWAQATREGERVSVVGDARRDRLWCVTYRVFPAKGTIRLDDGSLPTQTARDFTLLPADELHTAIPPDATLVTTDWERLCGRLQTLPNPARLITHACFPTADALGALACGPEGETLALDEPSPIYLHPAVATPPPFPAAHP
ncbi:MAG: tRNA (adenosine(37)-N6)-threonylcarbamoyltransferase complex dimerization subunit type 1 TsaB [Kiritimatiellae bacterium]|nr:tRNA (adenosine(37)-N6)-threonylcarbamoyltransferase complex dimerization subunit type 1 TsaB [Kiritimatiellia bacterium]